MWQLYLDNEMNTPTRIDYHLAQIAAEIRRSFVRNPANVRLSDFLKPVKFVRRSAKAAKAKAKQRLNAAKAFWFAATGLTGQRKRKN